MSGRKGRAKDPAKTKSRPSKEKQAKMPWNRSLARAHSNPFPTPNKPQAAAMAFKAVASYMGKDKTPK